MPTDQGGLLGGIGEGLKAGFDTYQEVKQRNIDNKYKKMQMDLVAKQAGYNEDPNTGSYVEEPLHLKQRNLQASEAEGKTPFQVDQTGALIKDPSGQAMLNPREAESESLAAMKSGFMPTQGQLGQASKNFKPFVPPIEQAKADATKFRIGATNETRQGTQAMTAGDKISDDKMIVQKSTQRDQLSRARRLLDKQNMTYQDFNDSQQEFAQAVAGARASTDSKNEATKYDSLEQGWKAILQKGSGHLQDAVPPEFVENLKANMDDMHNGLSRDMFERAKTKHSILKKALSNNPNAQAALDDALEQYRPQSEKKLPQGFMKPESGGMLSPGAGEKLKISNGKETLMIPPDALQDAMKDGFQVVK